MKTKSVVWLLVIAVLILMPLMAACGGSSTTAPVEEPKATEPVADEPADEEPAADEPAADEPAAEGPLAITHSLDGRADCLMCHETGIAGAAIIPADHRGRTNDNCTTCHNPAA